MNIVLDTNVLVSGLINPHGVPGHIINLVLRKDIILLTDERILHEYHEVLSRDKFGFSTQDILALVDFMRHESVHVIAQPLELKLEDMDDLPFMEVALSGNADFLITGNRKHFPDEDFIVTSQHFIKAYLSQQ